MTIDEKDWNIESYKKNIHIKGLSTTRNFCKTRRSQMAL